MCFFLRGLSQVLSCVSAIPPRNFRKIRLTKSVRPSQFTNRLRFLVARKKAKLEFVKLWVATEILVAKLFGVRLETIICMMIL